MCDHRRSGGDSYPACGCECAGLLYLPGQMQALQMLQVKNWRLVWPTIVVAVTDGAVWAKKWMLLCHHLWLLHCYTSNQFPITLHPFYYSCSKFWLLSYRTISHVHVVHITPWRLTGQSSSILCQRLDSIRTILDSIRTDWTTLGQDWTA